jgi:CheY-like chemotaxis protein
LTGYASAEDRERARDAGFDDHVAKPADAELLLRVVVGST